MPFDGAPKPAVVGARLIEPPRLPEVVRPAFPPTLRVRPGVALVEPVAGARVAGALPITRDDIAGWRAYIAAAVDSAPTMTDPRGSGGPMRAMAYLSRDAQGGLVVVEEMRTRVGALALSNMYRLPPGHGAQRLDQIAGMGERMRRAGKSPPVPSDSRRGGLPGLTSETLGGLRDNITGEGHRFNVFTPAGRSVSVEARVMELDSLIASHLGDGAANPAYPHAEGVQPRDRGTAPSRAQVDEIAARLSPDRLGPSPEAGAGAPIVGPDGVVESGNGRVAALRRVFDDPALAAQRDAYLDWLAGQGLEAAGFRKPVLVSRRVSALTPAERVAFVREANSRHDRRCRVQPPQPGSCPRRGRRARVQDRTGNPPRRR